MACIAPLPPPAAVARILIWHQGALGDLLLAGPALLAIRRHYPRAGLVGLGQPERWGLLTRILSLEEVWDSGEARWAQLFNDSALSPELKNRLAPFQLALVFSPNSETPVPALLREAGIPAVHWLPSFPAEGPESVVARQARHLAALGLAVEPGDFRLTLPEDCADVDFPEFAEASAWLAVAPGSGQPKKNWPLSHYYEVSRALAWQYQLGVVWLAGPAEASWLPYLKALTAAQGQVLLTHKSLAQVAAVLSHCRLFLGNDSGLTHLAAALGGPRVLALFGPTDPGIWAPPGAQVKVLTGPCSKAPCARGRKIPCPRSQCLEDLSPEQVMAVAGSMLRGEQA